MDYPGISQKGNGSFQNVAGSFDKDDKGEKDRASPESRDSVVSFKEFSENTTLHGMRYIGDNSSVIPRRTVWLALVLICGTLFALQVGDRVQYFMDSPVTVNYMVNYNKTMAFPAVTICNQNIFRISEAYKTNWLRFIESIYGDHSQQQEDSNGVLERPDAPISELFENLAHKKEDFIVRCQWANEECSVANFTTTPTSHGVCFTFNKVSRPEDSLTIQSSGVEHALRLTLNTEHYERMAGPHKATGIKMLVTDQSQVPMVDEIGLAISTGTHAFVGLTVLTLNNRPPPHGVCGEVDLLSTNRFTQESCMMECKTKFAFKKCGCRHFYMPNLNGQIPLCSVAVFVNCLQGALQNFNDIVDTICRCPISCYYHIYGSTVSYATSSHMKADLKGVVNEDEFKDRYVIRCFASKEISSKTDRELRNEFSTYVHGANLAFDYLTYLINIDFKRHIHFHDQVLRGIREETEAAIREHKTMYEFQKFVVQKNFMRGRDAVEENTFRYICQDYYGFVRDIENKVSIIVANAEEDSPVAKVMYLLLKSSLGHQKETLNRAMDDYTELVNAYQHGAMLLNFTYQDFDWSDHLAIIPRDLLKESISRDYLEVNTSLEERHIQYILEIINNFEVYSTTLFENKTHNTSKDHARLLSGDFRQACESFLSKKSIFYSDVLDRPNRILKQRIETFYDLEKEYKSIYDDLFDNILFLNKSLTEAQGYSIPQLNDSLIFAMDYLDSVHLENVTKYDVANKLTSHHMENDIHTVELFLEDLGTRGIEIHEAWTTLENKILAIWKHISGNGGGAAFYQHRRVQKFLQTYEERKSEIDDTISAARDTYDIREVFESVDHTIMETVKHLVAELDLYYKSHEINEEFYRQNFLQVDVYFKELRGEQIDQQIAYDAIALLCDIGGATGLFIGGSVLTVFEIVEFAFLCIMCRICIRKRKQRNVKEKE